MEVVLIQHRKSSQTSKKLAFFSRLFDADDKTVRDATSV